MPRDAPRPRKPHDNPKVRINIMLPKNLVDTIDSVTTNRSRFLTEAAMDKLLAMDTCDEPERERMREAIKKVRAIM
jgi:hypothetical protein